MTDAQFLTGKIIRILSDKGFGFIKVEGQKDLFFHANDCENGLFDQLEVGQTLRFTIGESQKGPKAENIEIVVEMMDGEDAMEGSDELDTDGIEI